MQRRIASFLFQRTSEEPYIFPRKKEAAVKEAALPAAKKQSDALWDSPQSKSRRAYGRSG